MSQLPDFNLIGYNPHAFAYGIGVEARIISPMFVWTVDKEAADAAEKRSYEQAKALYEQIKVGVRFKASGDRAVKGIVAMFTRINPISNTVSWRMVECPPAGDPARGKWSLASVVHMLRCGQIELLS